MALGPEMIFQVSEEIAEHFAGNTVRKAEAADHWLALFPARGRILLLSWDSDFYGCCEATPRELRELADAASARPPILEAIRSHLVGTRLVFASTVNRDRVLRVEFKKTIGAGFHRTRYLLLEASGRYSNLLLLDERETILEAAKHIHPESNRYRSLLPGCVYIPPPPAGEIDLSDFDAADEDAPKRLHSVKGIGKPLIDAILNALDDEPEQKEEILDGLKRLASSDTIEKSATPDLVYQSLGKYVTLFPLALSGATVLDERRGLVASRRCVVRPLLLRHVERYRKKLRTRLTQLSKSVDRKIAEAERLAGDESGGATLLAQGRLILANAWSIPPRTKEVTLKEWSEEGERLHTIPLDPSKTPAQNAERLFVKYKKKRAASERAKKALPSLYAERETILEQTALVECHTDITTLASMISEILPGEWGPGRDGRVPRQSSLPPHRRFEFPWADASLFVGLSAKGNHYVTFRLAKSDDIWMHARGIPGAHVILRFGRQPEKEAFERMLGIAASCAAYHSRGRESARVRVDHTERKHVRAIVGGGPGRVTYGEFSTIQIDTAIWVREIEALSENPADPREEGNGTK